ncbi:hypothetical protein D3C72_2084320 [compost metagenome]
MALAKISAAMWPALPLPAELKVAGSALACAMKSGSVLAFTEAAVVKLRPDELKIISGLRSLAAKGIEAYRCGLTVKVLSMPSSTV